MLARQTEAAETRVGLVLIVVYLAALLLLLRETAFSMVYFWGKHQTYNHGYLIAPITLWLIWERRDALDLKKSVGSWLGVAALSGAGFLWFLGGLADAQVVQQFAFVAMIVCGVWTILGTELTKFILFPLLYLFFMVPVGDGLVPPMMEFTATSTVELVRLSGIPVYREGLYFSLPSGSWNVIAACSGVRYLIASVALCALFAYLNYSRWVKRALFMVAAIIVPILANAIRAYTIVMIGHFSGMELAVGVDHLIWGWVFFGFVMFILFSVGSLWRDQGAWQHALVADHAVGLASRGRKAQTIVIGGVAVLLVALWSGLTHVVNGIQPPPYNPQIQLPEAIGSWRFTPETPWSWRPGFRGEDRAAHGVYVNRGNRVGVTLQQYMRQEQGAEVVPSGAFLTKQYRDSWRVVGKSPEKLHPNGRSINATRLVLEGPGAQRLVVLYWYWIAGSHLSDPYLVKIRETLSRLTLDTPRSARIYVVFEEDAARFESDPSQGFLDQAIGSLEAALESSQ